MTNGACAVVTDVVADKSACRSVPENINEKFKYTNGKMVQRENHVGAWFP